MTHVILFLLLWVGGGLVAWYGGAEIAKHSIWIKCTCGARRVRVICVDPIDAKRKAALLTEDCPRCREAVSHKPSVPARRDPTDSSLFTSDTSLAERTPC